MPGHVTPETLARLISRARRQLLGALREHVAPQDLSLPLLQILKRVVRGPQGQNELARDLEQQPANLSRLVAELEERKLIRRQRDASDQRRVIVEATGSGRELIARLQPDFQAAYAEVFGRLTPAEKTTLAALLTKLAGELP